MRLRVALLALLLVGCLPEPGAPSLTVEFRCESDVDCPDAFTCRPALGRCLPEAGLDTDVPALAAKAIEPAAATAGTTVDLTITPSEPLFRAPAVGFLVGGDRFDFSYAGEPVGDRGLAGELRYRFDVSAEHPEGSHVVRAQLVDTSGNSVELELGTLTLDFDPPEVLSGSVAYVPGADNALPTVTAAKAGTTIVVTAFASEALAPSVTPTLRLVGPADVELTAASDAVNTSTAAAVFEVVVPAGAVDGTYVPRIEWADSVGNGGEASFASPAILVVSSAPELIVTQELVTYVRSPLGNRANECICDEGAACPPLDAADAADACDGYFLPAGPSFELAPGGALSGLSSTTTLEPAAFQLSGRAIAGVRVWADGAGASLLGALFPDADGRWPRQRLANLDAPAAFVTGLDAAGAESAPVRLLHAEWVATSAAPALGASPHRLLSTVDVEGARAQSTAAPAPAATLARADATWREAAISDDKPELRVGHAMAYDSARGAIVLFGGNDAGDTWEWDGRRWVDVTPEGASPSPREELAMVYDSARGVMVLFGGRPVAGSGGSDDTWEWDGTAWTEVATDGVVPAPRAGHAMAYDSERGVVALFGGEGVQAFQDQTVWEWDGALWTSIPAPVPAPATRAAHAMAYDAARQQVVVFAGNRNADAVLLQDTWSWDGATWTEASAAPSAPSARRGHALAYDAAREVVVLVSGGFGTAVDDVWEWNGGGWSDVTPAGERPRPRQDHAVAFDAARGETVVFGGLITADGVGLATQETWEWNGGRWADRTPFAITPTARDSPALVHDAARGHVMLFAGLERSPVGGFNASVNDTWTWDGLRWVDITPVDGNPPARSTHGFTYDSLREVVVVFGGNAGCSFSPCGTANDTWEWDGTSWAPASPASAPPPRREAAIAFDAVRDIVVLFGGFGGGTTLGDTWEWDGTTWTQATPSGVSPTPRFQHKMVYDEARAVTVLFGGTVDNNVVGDTWEWDGLGWSEKTSTTTPPLARRRHALTYDSSRERVVLFSGLGSLVGRLEDTWEWDGTSWAEVTVAGAPPTGRSGHALAYDADRDVAVMFGGGTVPETWELRRRPERQPALQLEVAARGTGVSADNIEQLRVRAQCGGRYAPYAPDDVGAALFGWASGGLGRPAGSWSLLATNDVGADVAGELIEWAAPDEAAARRFITERDVQLTFQCRPDGVSGRGSAEVAMSYIEVRVSYRTQ